MTPESNTISIIVPMYNAAQTIDRCVASVFSQRFPDMELLLIDDGSTDDTLARCETLAAGRPDVRVIARPHAGVSATRNAGLDAARGEWVLFLDADDRLAVGALRLLAAHMGPETDAIHGLIGCEGAIATEPERAFTGEERHAMLDFAMADATHRLAIGGWMLRRSIVQERFDPTLSLGEDSEWLLRCLARCRGARFLGSPVYLVSVSGGSVTRSWRAGKAEAYLETLKRIARTPAAQQENWPLFVLTTLLLILTHDTFHPMNPLSPREQLRAARALRQTPLFADALARAELSRLGFAKRATLTCLRRGWVRAVRAAVRARQWQNARQMEDRHAGQRN